MYIKQWLFTMNLWKFTMVICYDVHSYHIILGYYPWLFSINQWLFIMTNGYQITHPLQDLVALSEADLDLRSVQLCYCLLEISPCERHSNREDPDRTLTGPRLQDPGSPGSTAWQCGFQGIGMIKHTCIYIIYMLCMHKYSVKLEKPGIIIYSWEYVDVFIIVTIIFEATRVFTAGIQQLPSIAPTKPSVVPPNLRVLLRPGPSACWYHKKSL